MGILLRTAHAAVLTVGLALAMAAIPAAPATADDPDFLSFAVGQYDFNQRDDEATELRLEYRSDEKVLWIFKPFAAFTATTDATLFLHAGLLVDVFLGRRIVLTWSEAPGYYHRGDSGKDLGHPLEFRSQIELAYRFDDRSRLGVSVSHVSNAGFGDNNPGAESIMVHYSIPVDRLLGE